jgi:hypothetical protein
MTIDLADALNQPLSIGNRTIRTRLVLAPMSMLGHVAFRELLASFGGYGLLFTEMCSAGRIPHESRHVSAYFNWRDEELSTLVCQIVGEDPATMAAAARIIEDQGFFGVDINFGCSAASICGRNCGAALLKEPSRAAQIVAAVRKTVSIPLFVKFRTGWCQVPYRVAKQSRTGSRSGAAFCRCRRRCIDLSSPSCTGSARPAAPVGLHRVGQTGGEHPRLWQRRCLQPGGLPHNAANHRL